MKRLRSRSGFTLAEVVISTTVAALVLGAVSAVMILGLRYQGVMSRKTKQMQEARTLFTLLEQFAAAGNLRTGENGSVLCTADERELFRFDGEKLYYNQNVFLDGVSDFSVAREGSVLHIRIAFPETGIGEEYTLTLYCRPGFENSSA